MTKQFQDMQPEDIRDADLDQVAGADKRHSDWIPILGMSSGVSRPKSEIAPPEEFSLNFEEIKVT